MSDQTTRANLLERMLTAFSWGNYAILVAILAATILFKGFLNESLWLDELLSFWITKDSFGDLISRSSGFLGLSPFPHIAQWLDVHFVGTSELVLRIPSVIWTALSCLVLYHIASTALQRDAAILTIIAFIVIDSVLVSAMSFRPYALSLLFSLLSVWYLIRWCASRSFHYSLLFAIFSVSAVYNHYLFIGLLGVHCAYVFSQRAELSRRFFGDFAFVMLLIIGATLPGVFQCIEFVRQHGELSFRPRPTVNQLVEAILPLYMVLYLVTAFLLAFLNFGKVPCEIAPQKRPFLLFVITWYLFGPLLLFAYSLASGSSVFVPRYFLWSAPGMALLVGFLLDTLRSNRARRLAICVFALMAFVRESGRIWKLEDWRAVPEAINKVSQEAKPVVLLYTGLLENKRVGWLTNEHRRPYLIAPFVYYPLEAMIQPLPPLFESSAARSFYTETVKPLVEKKDQFFFVCLDQQLIDGTASIPICENHRLLFSQLGFSGKTLSSQMVQIFVFNRTEKL